MSDALVTSATKPLYDNGATYGSKQVIGTDLSQIFLYKDFASESLGSNMSALPEFDTTTAVISDEQSYSGGKSTKHTITAGDDGFGDFGYRLTTESTPKLVKGDEIWFRQAMFFPTGWDMTTNTGRLKCFRWILNKSDNTFDGDIDVQIKTNKTGMSGYIESHPNPAYHQWYEFPDAAILLNAWQLWEVHIVLDDVPVDEGGSGRVDLWLDGNHVGSLTAMSTLQLPDNYLNFMYLFTYWNGNAPQTQSMYIDNVTVAVKQSGVRDDSQYLTTDSEGRSYIGVGV